MPVDYVAKIRRCDKRQLEAMLQQLSGGQPIPGWSRGKAFEHLILRGFEIEGAEVVWPYEVKVERKTVEQIDGAVHCEGLYCLVEAKDYSDPITIEPVAKLRNQLARRPPGALGLIFARNGFTEPAIYLTRMNNPLNVLLWEFEELQTAVNDGAMRRALVTKFKVAVERGTPDYNIRGGYR